MAATSGSPETIHRAREHFEREALPHLPALHSYALRLLSGDDARAEDAVQEAVLKAYRSWHTYTPGTNCKAWLLTIVRNVVLSGHAVDARERRLDQSLLVERAVFTDVEASDPEGTFFNRIVDHSIIDAIDHLSALSREAIVLKEILGLGYEEIAGLLEVPLGTVKSRLFRARQALQRELYEYAVTMGYVRPRTAAARSDSARTSVRNGHAPNHATRSSRRPFVHRDRLARLGHHKRTRLAGATA